MGSSRSDVDGVGVSLTCEISQCKVQGFREQVTTPSFDIRCPAQLAYSNNFGFHAE